MSRPSWYGLNYRLPPRLFRQHGCKTRHMCIQMGCIALMCLCRGLWDGPSLIMPHASSRGRVAQICARVRHLRHLNYRRQARRSAAMPVTVAVAALRRKRWSGRAHQIDSSNSGNGTQPSSRRSRRRRQGCLSRARDPRASKIRTRCRLTGSLSTLLPPA